MWLIMFTQSKDLFNAELQRFHYKKYFIRVSLGCSVMNLDVQSQHRNVSLNVKSPALIKPKLSHSHNQSPIKWQQEVNIIR